MNYNWRANIGNYIVNQRDMIEMAIAGIKVAFTFDSLANYTLSFSLSLPVCLSDCLLTTN